MIVSVRSALPRGSSIAQKQPKLSNAAWTRITIRSFYRQLGKDPDLLLSAALELLAHKFSL
jgi:hypothetical protein